VTIGWNLKRQYQFGLQGKIQAELGPHCGGGEEAGHWAQEVSQGGVGPLVCAVGPIHISVWACPPELDGLPKYLCLIVTMLASRTLLDNLRGE